MGIHYTDLLHRLNINNNSVLWPEHEDVAFSTTSLLSYFHAFVAIAELDRSTYWTAGPNSGGVTL
jgi:hypothetical protein